MAVLFLSVSFNVLDYSYCMTYYCLIYMYFNITCSHHHNVTSLYILQHHHLFTSPQCYKFVKTSTSPQCYKFVYTSTSHYCCKLEKLQHTRSHHRNIISLYIHVLQHHNIHITVLLYSKEKLWKCFLRCAKQPDYTVPCQPEICRKPLG